MAEADGAVFTARLERATTILRRYQDELAVAATGRAGLQRLDEPGSYESLPRRVRGRDGLIRPWRGEIA